MTRREKFTRIGAALTLFTAMLRGMSYIEAGKLQLGVTMVALTTIGWGVLLWRIRRQRQNPD